MGGGGATGGAPHEHAGDDELELADVVLEAQAPRRVRVEAEVHHHTLRGRWGVRDRGGWGGGVRSCRMAGITGAKETLEGRRLRT